MLNNESHTLTIRVEWELTKDLVHFFSVCELVVNFHYLLCALLQDQTTLFSTLDQCKLIRTRGLILCLTSSWVNIYDNCMTDCEQSEEIIQGPALTFIERRSIMSLFLSHIRDHILRNCSSNECN